MGVRVHSAQAPPLMSPDSCVARGSAGKARSPHRVMRTLSPTDSHCVDEVGTARLQAKQSMSITLQPLASIEGGKTRRDPGSRRESNPAALAPVRPRASLPQGRKSEAPPHLRRSTAKRLSDPATGLSPGGPPLAITKVLHSPPL